MCGREQEVAVSSKAWLPGLEDYNPSGATGSPQTKQQVVLGFFFASNHPSLKIGLVLFY